MELPRYEKFKSAKNNEYYFRLRSKGNGEIILASEGYTTSQARDKGINSVRLNSQQDDCYNRKQNKESYTFVLEARNGEPIGRSESYSTLQARENGIISVKRDAPLAVEVTV
ncbi:MAG: YegP family protein [Saprospiraceae bacterium]|nr:YegP family protein [Saprospiraceae bacterium]